MNLAPILSLLGALPEFAALVAGVRAGLGRVTLIATEGAKPAAIAALADNLKSPILIVTSRAEAARQLTDQIVVWSGRPDRIAHFPDPSGLPFEDLPGDPAAGQVRLEILTELHEWDRSAGPPIVVASIHAAAQKVIGPRAIGDARLDLRVKQRIGPKAVADRLVELGYETSILVDRPGAFSRRGGILDIAPPTHPVPIRIEFFGDQIDTLREFNPETQRSTKLIDAIAIGPASDTLARTAAGRAEALLEGLDFTGCPPDLAAEWREALRRQLGQPRTLSNQFAGLVEDHCLIDHLPAGAVVVVDEWWAVEAAAREIWRQGQEIAAGRRAKGTLPAGLPAPILDPAELQARLDGRRVIHLGVGEVEGEADLEGPDRPGTGAAVEHSPDGGGPVRLPIRPPARFAGRLRDLGQRVADLRLAGAGIVVISQQAPRLAELLRDEIPLERPTGRRGSGNRRSASAARVTLIEGDLRRRPEPGEAAIGSGSLSAGIELLDPAGGVRLAVLTDGEIFGVSKVRRTVRARRVARDDHLADIQPGDHVVHIEHGIGRFDGLQRLSLDGQAREYLVIAYAENDKLYVPVDQANRVSRYIGARDDAPRLTRLGTSEWTRVKERARRAVRDIAADLLRIYAARQVRPGHAYPADTHWQVEMEQAFPYVETPDQLQAVEAVKEDLERAQPMDRLICGDVGYGKTEVALRAAFKVVQDGRQVAVLVPTTVLAQQHYQTFSQRLAAFPVNVARLSRFLTDREQAKVIAGLREGSVDICIGTHRMLQADVVFKDPGLLIIDEEQRFGVLHKEQLKRLRTEIDVLTMTATPIPRTLYQALVGARDMSTIETPPEERLPVRTYLMQYDDEIVRQAILRELDRGGQVYFVHNRVQSIGILARQLMDLVPEATFGVGHGQMPEEALEMVMADFAAGSIDVLVCSTIIESGLDIPNVNTIIINQSNRLGLSQLYQLRGRVGRSATRAYAYLLYEKESRLTPVAEQRLRAIFEASELGAGFRIAQKDLEIRGAGNLLGAEQSGHVSSVGFDLYTRLLAEAVADLKGEPRPAPAADTTPGPTLDLGLAAFLPPEYLPDDQLRLVLYRRIAGLAGADAVEAMASELYDRFGPLPAPVRDLLRVVKLRALAIAAGVPSIQASGDEVVIQADPVLAPGRESVAAALRDLARVGATQIRLERAGEWLDRLESILTRLAGLRRVAA